MKGQTRFHKLVMGGLAVLALSTGTAFAEPHGGVGHFGGGDHFAGAHPVFRGGGWHGAYRWYGPYWGGVGLGLYFATLPLYYDTYWWGGVPYYYADGTYYTWEPSVNKYVTVAPPSGLQSEVAAQGPAGAQVGSQLMAYPKNGQTAEQQAADKSACRQWASSQAQSSNQADLMRAESACLTGRGYSVQ